jgi:hypothetical protein
MYRGRYGGWLVAECTMRPVHALMPCREQLKHCVPLPAGVEDPRPQDLQSHW